MAQYLSQFYTGLESCLEKKLKLKEIDPPNKNERYHKALLSIALDEGLLPPSCSRIATDLLGFRHFARHAYGANFDPALPVEKTMHAESIWSEIEPLWRTDLEKLAEKSQ